MRSLTASLSLLALVAASLLTVGCGGAGTSTTGSGSSSQSYAQNYTNPTAPTGTQVYAPSIVLNTALSTGTTAVYDVVANAPNYMVRGVVCNLQVDTSKVTFVTVPNAAGAVDNAGFGGANAHMLSKLTSASTNLMVVTIRSPAAAKAASGTLMRFALALNSGTIAGVVRTEVMSGSGLVDANGRLIQNTSPVMGVIEVAN